MVNPHLELLIFQKAVLLTYPNCQQKKGSKSESYNAINHFPSFINLFKVVFIMFTSPIN